MSTADVRIQVRQDIAAAWTAENPVLLAGELGVETDTGQMKFGDGDRPWVDLPYVGGGLRAKLDGGSYLGGD